MLGDWSLLSGGLSRSLATALRDLIELGELRPGALLPSERALAEALAVSRTTVLGAYQALADEQLVARKVGSGTSIERPQAGSGPALNNRRGEDRVLRYIDAPLGTVDFVNAAVPGLPLVAEVAGSLTPRDYRHLMEDHDYSPLGLWDLRSAIAQQCSALGAPTEPEQILITSGAQQALELITAAMLRPGDLVAVEDPTFRAALQQLRASGVRIEAIPSDASGADISALERLLGRFPVRLVYMLPAAHNPTGSVTSRARARKLAALAAETQTIFVDDRSLTSTVFSGPELPPLAALAESDLIITVGSFSKMFWAGLRVGWIRASPRIVRGLGEVKTAADLGTSLVSQALVLRLLEHSEEAIVERHRVLTAGYRRLTSLLEEQLPDWSWQPPRCGSSLWVELPGPHAVAFGELAQRHGVSVLPGPVFSASEGQESRLRVPFSARPSVLDAGVQRLARAWREMACYGPHTARAPKPAD
jgi:DNA-binding transcriptional MocR family regulator